MLDVLLGMGFFDCLCNGVLVVFCEGGSTAASENAINTSWLIILGVRNDGLGVPCSTCSIWNIGFLPLVIVLESCLPCTFLIYVRHLIFSRVLYFSALFSFHFWSLFFSHSWPPSESAIGVGNSLTPSVFIIGVGIILGELFRTTCS